MTKLEKKISMRHPWNDEINSNIPREEVILAMEGLKKKSGNLGADEPILIDQKVSKSGLLGQCGK